MPQRYWMPDRSCLLFLRFVLLKLASVELYRYFVLLGLSDVLMFNRYYFFLYFVAHVEINVFLCDKECFKCCSGLHQFSPLMADLM